MNDTINEFKIGNASWELERQFLFYDNILPAETEQWHRNIKERKSVIDKINQAVDTVFASKENQPFVNPLDDQTKKFRAL